MDYESYHQSLEILEKLLIHFANSNEIELAEKVCGIITDCDHNYYQTLLIMANSGISETVSQDSVIEFRKGLAVKNPHMVDS
jgi:hypothetical protein